MHCQTLGKAHVKSTQLCFATGLSHTHCFEHTYSHAVLAVAGKTNIMRCGKVLVHHKPQVQLHSSLL